MKKPYRVTDAADGSVRIAGRFHRQGDVVHLSDKEATPELSRRLVEPWTTGGTVGSLAGLVGDFDGLTIDPVDHDGDGRKGGSLPGRRLKD